MGDARSRAEYEAAFFVALGGWRRADQKEIEDEKRFFVALRTFGLPATKRLQVTTPRLA